MKKTKIYDCQGEETEHLKYGDVFTIAADRKYPNWQMVMNGDKPKQFRLVPIK